MHSVNLVSGLSANGKALLIAELLSDPRVNSLAISTIQRLRFFDEMAATSKRSDQKAISDALITQGKLSRLIARLNYGPKIKSILAVSGEIPPSSLLLGEIHKLLPAEKARLTAELLRDESTRGILNALVKELSK